MSAYNIKWIWDQQVTPVQKLVLFALNEHCNPAHGDWRCFPSQLTLAKLTNLSDRAIRSNMADLERIGLIRVAHQYDQKGRQQSNMYWLNAPFIGAEPDSVRVEADSTPGWKHVPGGRWNDVPTNLLRDKPLKTNPTVPVGINEPAWSDWLDYLRARRKTPTDRTVALQHKRLLAFDLDTQRRMIERAIESGWQSFHELRENNNANRPGADSTQDRSAAGRVRANIARARAEREAYRDAVGNDVSDVRPPLDVELRRVG